MVIFLTKSQNLTREKKGTIFNKISKFLVRKGSIFSKNQLAKSIIFWTFLDRSPPNNGQKPLKNFARFARRILGSQKKFGALRARGSIFNKISKFRALRARGSIFNKISIFFARFAREVLLFPKSSRKSDPYGNSEGGGVNIKHSGTVFFFYFWVWVGKTSPKNFRRFAAKKTFKKISPRSGDFTVKILYF